MAKVSTAYIDNSGALHSTPTDATLADLATVIGRVGAEAGLTMGLAKLVLEKRPEIQQVFADHDLMVANEERSK